MKVSVADRAPTAVGVKVTVKFVLAPAASVFGSVSPLTVKTELLMLAAVIVTLAPLAVSVPLAVPLDPTVTVPTAIVVGETLNVPTGFMPVPVAVAVSVEFEALLLMVKVALEDPDAVGVNVTVKDALFPAAIVAGSESPLTLNTELLELIEFTVTLAPLTVRVPVAVPLDPTVTFPTAIVVGETLNEPTTIVPVPVAVAVSVEFEALLLIVSVALDDPETVGVNVTVKDALFPAAIVAGSESPLTVKAELLELIEFTVTLAPLAVSVPVAVPLEPTVTVPTAIVLGETLKVPTAVVPVPVAVAVKAEFDASLLMVSVAVEDPDTVGLNVTLNEALLPAAIVAGSESPLTV